MKIDLKELKNQALKEIERTSDSETLEKIEKKYLSRKKGELTLLLRGLKDLPIEKRRKIGPLANRTKNEIEEALKNKKLQATPASLREAGRASYPGLAPRSGAGKLQAEKSIDITLPGIKPELGHLHPITQFIRKTTNVFIRMGFEVVEGPEVETEEYNFDLLNIPPDHPARDVWDTYYLKNPKSEIRNSCLRRSEAPASRRQAKQIQNSNDQNSKLLLRTHTSSVQLRAMEKRKLPVRLIVPGRVFRHEATDAGHETTFYQLEGLVIDKGVRLTDLIGTLKVFSQAIFGKKTKIRVRPSYFPFTEPSIEIDISCLICYGKGCFLCGASGWLEVLGAGMVHPNVLRNMKVDPGIYTGFAFGMGIDRLMMLYYGVNDIRLSYEGDLRFLKQF